MILDPMFKRTLKTLDLCFPFPMLKLREYGLFQRNVNIENFPL